MTSTTTIEWTEQTWNPTTGCTKISPGCKHCYAEVMAKRLQAMGAGVYGHAGTRPPSIGRIFYAERRQRELLRFASITDEETTPIPCAGGANRTACCRHQLSGKGLGLDSSRRCLPEDSKRQHNAGGGRNCGGC